MPIGQFQEQVGNASPVYSAPLALLWLKTNCQKLICSQSTVCGFMDSSSVLVNVRPQCCREVPCKTKLPIASPKPHKACHSALKTFPNRRRSALPYPLAILKIHEVLKIKNAKRNAPIGDAEGMKFLPRAFSGRLTGGSDETPRFGNNLAQFAQASLSNVTRLAMHLV